MSTRCMVAAVTESGIKGVYVHCDGYPDGENGKLATLSAMIAEHELSKVVSTLLSSPVPWYSFDGKSSGLYEQVPGFGNRFDVAPAQGWTYYTDGPVQWDLEYVYLIKPDGTIQWADKGVTRGDVPWSDLEWQESE